MHISAISDLVIALYLFCEQLNGLS